MPCSMFIEPTITWVPSGFSGYIWLDTNIVLKMPTRNAHIAKNEVKVSKKERTKCDPSQFCRIFLLFFTFLQLFYTFFILLFSTNFVMIFCHFITFLLF